MLAWTTMAAFGMVLARHYRSALGSKCLGQSICSLFNSTLIHHYLRINVKSTDSRKNEKCVYKENRYG